MAGSGLALIYLLGLCVMLNERSVVIKNLRTIPSFKESGPLTYRVSLLNIPLGTLTLRFCAEPQTAFDPSLCQMELRLTPVNWLFHLSQKNLGLQMTTWMDKKTFLPAQYQLQNFYALKKGKPSKTVKYNHSGLFLEHKGKRGSILDDTRDILSTVYWLMNQDLDKVKLLKTTMNTNRRLYLVVGKSRDTGFKKNQGELIRVDFRFLKLKQEFQVDQVIPMKMEFVKKGDLYIPILIQAQFPQIPLTFSLIPKLQ